MNQSSRYMGNMGRAAVCLGVLALLGSGCSVTEHKHPEYEVNVQAVNDATAKADAAAGRAEAAAERAERAAAKAAAMFEKTMRK